MGVVVEGAYADLLLVAKTLQPLSTKWFDADPEYKLIPTIHLVMKDGEIDGSIQGKEVLTTNRKNSADGVEEQTKSVDPQSD